MMQPHDTESVHASIFTKPTTKGEISIVYCITALLFYTHLLFAYKKTTYKQQHHSYNETGLWVTGGGKPIFQLMQ